MNLGQNYVFQITCIYVILKSPNLKKKYLCTIKYLLQNENKTPFCIATGIDTHQHFGSRIFG